MYKWFSGRNVGLSDKAALPSIHVQAFLKSSRNGCTDASLSNLFGAMQEDLSEKDTFVLLAALIEEKAWTVFTQLVKDHDILLKSLNFSLIKYFKRALNVKWLTIDTQFEEKCYDLNHNNSTLDERRLYSKVWFDLVHWAMFNKCDRSFVCYLLVRLPLRRPFVAGSATEDCYDAEYCRPYQPILDIYHAIQKSGKAAMNDTSDWCAPIMQY
jgi:hypothetical protein